MYQLIFSDRQIYLADSVIRESDWLSPDDEPAFRYEGRGEDLRFRITDAFSCENLPSAARGLGCAWTSDPTPPQEGLITGKKLVLGVLWIPGSVRVSIRDSSKDSFYFFHAVRGKWAKQNKISDFEAAMMVDSGLLILDEKGCRPAPGTEEYALKAVRAYAGLMNQ